MHELQFNALVSRDLNELLVKLENEKVASIVGSKTSYEAILQAELCITTKKPQLIVLSNLEEAEHWVSDIAVSHPSLKTLLLPSSYKISNKELIIAPNREMERNLVLEAVESENFDILVTYQESLIEPILSSDLEIHRKVIKKYGVIDIYNYQDILENYGYEKVPFVYEHGQFALRGNILDIFSYSHKSAVRIELFDQSVETIKRINSETQLSDEELDELVISPSPTVKKQSKKQTYKSIFELLPNDTILWIEEGKAPWNQIKNAKRLFQELSNDEKPQVWISETKIKEQVDKFYQILINNQIEHENIKSITTYSKNFNKIYHALKKYNDEGYTINIASIDPKQLERLKQIFDDLGGGVSFIEKNDEFYKGFEILEGKFLWLNIHELLSKRKSPSIKNPISSSVQARLLKSIQELEPGDYVTHIDYGVGKFSGLEKIETNGKINEAVRLIYANGDVLYIHINSIHKISKYVGKDGIEPTLHRLGSDTWTNIKSRTKKKIKDIAADLIKLYAKRKASKGFTFSPDTYMQLEMESSFEYEDTPDQTQATIDVKKDMEREMPMDRLICGDVGFGKTEVAIRAAFKAVSDSKQVAVLVPTTLLAFQHYHTFSKRLEGFPCNVEFVNRFKSAKEKKEILTKLKEGKIDIIIGTHALLGKEVEFKDLGLLIVDEEQKFGVAAKEKLKNFKLNVDVLTMTATPIPRTLQFSLLGARDYSLIQTPPPSRQSVYTEATRFDPEYIAEIIDNELQRGGQVFFVHNRIKDLDQIRQLLEKSCPNAKIATAHGQLKGHEIEEILIDYIEKEYDVLLSTNIIESGIDIPNANTIIINNAQNFGLSDLHQLRGRVGRSNQKAYCYLLTPPMSTLTQEARQRMLAMEQNAMLGSGFQIALRDLDLRGAGNLLGGEQSGFITDIGYDTYLKILDEAIRELKEGEYKELYKKDDQAITVASSCQIETDENLYIPDNYMPSSQERLQAYSDLNHLKNEEELSKFIKKMRDIYGQLPKEMNSLFDSVRLKWLAMELGFEKISIKSGKMKCHFISNEESSYFQESLFGEILSFVAQSNGNIVLKQSNQGTFLAVSNTINSKGALEFLTQLKSYSLSNQKASN